MHLKKTQTFIQFCVLFLAAKEDNEASSKPNFMTSSKSTNLQRWIRIFIYVLFMHCGKEAAKLLGRIYHKSGGKSILMETFTQLAGFPLLFPYLYISEHSSGIVPALFYIVFGIFLQTDSIMNSDSLLYLPVSAFSLICGFQTLFNARFWPCTSAPFIINSLVLCIISSSLVIFQANSINSIVSYAAGFLCIIGASTGYGLILYVTQMSFKMLQKRERYIIALEIMIYQSLVAACSAVVGLIISGEWKDLKREMQGFELGRLSYVMILVETAIASQIFTLGAIGLILEFSNVGGLPIVPILAVLFFQDKMNGVKIIIMVLSMWGFISYIHQYYLDNYKREMTNVDEFPNSFWAREE